MSEKPNPDILAKAIKALTIAIWCLCAVGIAQLGFYLFSYTSAWRYAHGGTDTLVSTKYTHLSGESSEGMIQEKPFDEYTPEEMVANASVIMVTAYHEDGKKYRAIVSEILKRDPNVVLDYKVGDEYPELSYDKKENFNCGEGQIVFMVGSPASMRASYNYVNGRIAGLGDMPFVLLREIVKVYTK